MVQRVEDKEILKLVTQRLARTGLASQTPVTVAVHHGSVVITGAINFEYQRKVALKAAQGVHGVQHVVDHLRVQQTATPQWHAPPAAEHLATPHYAPLSPATKSKTPLEGGEHPSATPTPDEAKS